MAKLKNPLFSLEASNKLGPLSLRRHTLGQAIAGAKPIPSQPQTWPQKYHRWLYTDYVHWWGALSNSQRNAWKQASWRLGITPYNAFMRNRLLLKPDIGGAWHLDEAAGSLAQDLSQNNNIAVLFGPSWADGLYRSCLSFDGVDDYLRIPHDDSISPTTAITFSAWVRLNSTAGAGRIVEKGQPFANRSYRINLNGAGLYSGMVKVGGAEKATPTFPAAANVWIHLALRYDGSYVDLLINGELITPRTAAAGTIEYEPGVDLHIGGTPVAASTVSALIDEPRVYNRALSDFQLLKQAQRR